MLAMGKGTGGHLESALLAGAYGWQAPVIFRNCVSFKPPAAVLVMVRSA